MYHPVCRTQQEGSSRRSSSMGIGKGYFLPGFRIVNGIRLPHAKPPVLRSFSLPAPESRVSFHGPAEPDCLVNDSVVSIVPDGPSIIFEETSSEAMMG